MSVEKYIKDNIRKIGDKVYVVPEIPEKKLNNAILSIAPNIIPDYVLAIVDSTVFGSAKEGLIFTGEIIYKKYAFEERQEYRFENIEKAEYQVTNIEKNNGKIEQKEQIFLHMNDGSKTELSSNLMMYINVEKLAELINEIIDEAGEERNYKSTSQMQPLSSMDSEVKDAYIKIICNYVYDQNREIESVEYAEIVSLLVRIDYNSENRLNIRSYMCDRSQSERTEDLIEYISENVPQGSLEVIYKSIIKDIIYIFKAKNDIDQWEKNEYIVTLKNKLEVSDEHIKLIIDAIINDEEILSKRKNDSEIKKSMKDLVAKAGAVGVPLAAIYFSGSVVGMSAAGITSGLAALGMGGVLGFSSMFTGIGAAVLLGVGAYKGIKKVTGIGDLENNKQREMMLQAIIKNSQKSLDYLIEDVNEISRLLMDEMKNGYESTRKIEKLSKLLSMMSKGAKETSSKISYAESECIISRLPKKLDITRVEELTNDPTKQKLREYILSCYMQQSVISQDFEEEKIEYLLNDKLSLNELDQLHSVFDSIGYTNITDAVFASAKGITKNIMKNFR